MANLGTPETLADYIRLIKRLIPGQAVNDPQIEESMVRFLTYSYSKDNGLLTVPSVKEIPFLAGENKYKQPYKVFDVIDCKARILPNTNFLPFICKAFPNPTKYEDFMNEDKRGVPNMIYIFNDQMIIYPKSDNPIDVTIRLTGYFSIMEYTEDLTDAVVQRIPYANSQLVMYSVALDMLQSLGMSTEAKDRITSMLEKQIGVLSPVSEMNINRLGCNFMYVR